ncbi:MAG: hypothetical protein AMXMBFR23_28450 [Chloroflexota bacterium]
MKGRILLLCAMLALPHAARASGLVGDGALVPLSSLAVEASITDDGASLVERRGFFAIAGDVVLYRSLSPGETVTAVLSGGEPIPFEVLTGSEGDAERVALTTALGDPAPLRELGAPLLVAHTVAAGSFWAPALVLEVHTQQPLSARGTMRGVSIPVGWHPQPVDSVEIQASIATQDPLRAVYSPYHPLQLTRTGATSATATYGGWERCSSFDVTLLISTGSEPLRLDLLPHREGDEPGSFLALLTPDAEPADIQPRSLALVVDRSGSMGDWKMAQARQAVSAVLGGLRPTDSFSVVAFDGAIEVFAPTALPATPENVAAALGFVEGIQSGGATNLYDAIQAGLQSLPATGTHPRYLVVLTDGVPTAGETDIDAILGMVRAQNEVGARVFSFGIGYDVNTVLLDTMALESGGDSIYVTGSVEAAVAEFFAQIADPVVANPSLDVSGIGGELLEPAVLPDLFAGQTLVVAGRYVKAGTGTIIVNGSTTHAFAVTLPERAVAEGYVPRVWATRRVGTLLEQVKLGGGDSYAQAALELARRYGVVTAFTYFLVDEGGDTVMTYSPVPVAAVGESAVSTSSSLDSYQKGGSAEAIDSFVRYHRDRTFPTLGGSYTDTSLGADEAWVDVRFGSPLYWSLVEQEKGLGIGGFLAIGANVRFELLGRAFRVRVDGTESAEIPDPAAHAPEGEATVACLDGERVGSGVTYGEGPTGVGYGGGSSLGGAAGGEPAGAPVGEDGVAPSTEAPTAGHPLAHPGGTGGVALSAATDSGCAAAPVTAALPQLLLLALGVLTLRVRRR